MATRSAIGDYPLHIESVGETLPVAVLIAAHNRADWVGEAVSSALAQRPNPPAEVIVIDDASTDGTADAARAAGARVISHEHNLGAAAARNTGAASTAQPWIAPLDSDDRWLPHMLTALWPLRDEYGFVAGASLAIDDHHRPITYGGSLAPGPIVLATPAPLVFPENFVPASGVLIRRQTFQEAGGYRIDQRQAEDFDLWLRVLQLRPALCIPRVVTVYRVHAGQKSRGGTASRAAILRIIERYRDDPWYRAELVERRRAVMAWDDLREALRERQPRRVLARAWWLSRRRARRGAVRATVIRRREGRRRAAGWDGALESIGAGVSAGVV